jgi:hypothetical protein
MPFNIGLYFRSFYISIFHSKGTPGRLSPKRLFLVLFLFFAFPIWNLYIRLGYALDKVLFPGYKSATFPDPVFIIGNYRSGSTFFHRLLLRDPQFTCLKVWEIYFAPALTHRKFLRLILRISARIGSPAQKFISWFDKSLNEIYSMHKTGMYTFEQDSQLFYHTWSSYNLFAIFPFPELAKQFIYYDQLVPEDRRNKDFTYYTDVLKRHMFVHPGKGYIAKNPDFSPAVETLMEFFPNAKFINIVRPPEGMIPSLVNLWASNFKAYGSPSEPYPLIDILLEKARHWYSYPHTRLMNLPPDRYQVVDFIRFIGNPKEVIEDIYKHFGYQMTEEYQEILAAETIKARQYSNHRYCPSDMGIDLESIKEDFAPVIEPIWNTHSGIKKTEPIR